ncbi:MAG: hypothetical protein AB1412_10430 [Pseudomonadota bacterium]
MPLAVPIYSSNQSGLICGYLFDAEGRGQPLELNEAARWLHEEKPQDDAFVWLHFNAANVSSEKCFRPIWTTPNTASRPSAKACDPPGWRWSIRPWWPW